MVESYTQLPQVFLSAQNYPDIRRAAVSRLKADHLKKESN